MELNHILKVIRRWALVIAITLVVIAVVAGWRLIAAGSLYESSVKIQLTAPQSEDVTIFTTNRTSTNVRDDITVARNNFTEILQSDEVFNRVVKQLGLSGEDAKYSVDVRALRDSDYFNVVVQSRNVALVGQIANAHVNMAIAYYGEVRSKPASASKNFLAEQVATADKRVRTAEGALADFQAQNHVSNVNSEIEIDQQVLRDLVAERNKRLLEGPTSRIIEADNTVLTQLRVERENANAQGDDQGVARYDLAILNYTQAISQAMDATDSVSPVDNLIAQYRDDLTRLTALQPLSTTLQNDLVQARNDYQQIQSKYNEAVLKEQTAADASFIQVISPGLAPEAPIPGRASLVIALALVGVLVVGVVLAFILEYIFPAELQLETLFKQPARKKVDVVRPVRESVRR